MKFSDNPGPKYGSERNSILKISDPITQGKKPIYGWGLASSLKLRLQDLAVDLRLSKFRA